MLSWYDHDMRFGSRFTGHPQYHRWRKGGRANREERSEGKEMGHLVSCWSQQDEWYRFIEDVTDEKGNRRCMGSRIQAGRGVNQERSGRS